jgi:glycosyltransferase involved in cell wall biosynthesis
MDNSIDLSIIIPCYNEGERLSHTIKETVKVALDLDINYEILLVND